MNPDGQTNQPAKQQLIERLKQATNVLVTVSTNPSVDQLASCVGFTLMLNKLGKHCTAVFSGTVPSTIEFLQPEKTLEKNTDSLRDFIISLDKSKADKLRYKVEDQFVKIFISPYKTSLGEKDLVFSQGDFNVDVVVALGVHKREELDQAIIAHGRILHDATVISVNNRSSGDLGTINWQDTGASSLAEMLVTLGEELKPGLQDGQMATAFLTGIVSETKRFSNEKTTPTTMSIASKLMNAGANQQLVASKLEEPKPIPKPLPPKKTEASIDLKAPKDELPKPSDGALEVHHDEPKAPTSMPPLVADEEELEESLAEKINIDNQGTLHRLSEENKLAPPQVIPGRIMNTPPSMDTRFTANSEPEALDPSTDPLSGAPTTPTPLLGHNHPASNTPPDPDSTLTEVEKSVHSPHLQQNPPQPVDSAREAVTKASASQPERLGPVQALNAQRVELDTPAQAGSKLDEILKSQSATDNTAGSSNPSSPPPVPPPMMPPTPGPSGYNNSSGSNVSGTPL